MLRHDRPRLRQPLVSKEEIENRHDIVEAFSSSQEALQLVQSALKYISARIVLILEWCKSIFSQDLGRRERTSGKPRESLRRTFANSSQKGTFRIWTSWC